MSSRPDTVVYYFGFPHYRREILAALEDILGDRLTIISGSASRSSIATLTVGDVPRMLVVPTVRIGPFTWDRGVFVRTLAARGPVILGPAATSLTTLLLLVARRLRSRPTYLWGQCGRPGDRSWRRYLQEGMNRLATGLMVYGRAESDAAQELGLSSSRVHIVRNATTSNDDALGEAAEMRILNALDLRRRRLSAGEIRILFVGRLLRSKRIPVLLDAGRLLSRKYPSLVIDIVGGGEALEELKAAYAESMFRFHGWMYEGPARDALFEQATFVASPYHMGLIAVDSLRYGVPVLVPDNPMNASEVEALTPGVHARSFAAGDVQDLARVADAWISDQLTTDAGVYLAERNRSLQLWSPTAVAKEIASVIG